MRYAIGIVLGILGSLLVDLLCVWVFRLIPVVGPWLALAFCAYALVRMVLRTHQILTAMKSPFMYLLHLEALGKGYKIMTRAQALSIGVVLAAFWMTVITFNIWWMVR